ncbi:MAG: MATE family efflux transporter [Alphaproteobacteria bacterium]|nr:MATE family efflux transporter [Alphaproteobacteria bacterium]
MQNNSKISQIKNHIFELIKLAIPVIIARIGIVSMEFADTLMVGRLSAAELAYQGIAYVPILILDVILLGLLNGTLVMIAKFFGSKEYKECGAVLWRSAMYAFLLSVTAPLVCVFGEEILLLTGQTPELSKGGGIVVFILGIGVPLTMLHFVAVSFLEGISRPTPAMIMMIIANILNVFLNWVFIYGNLGFESMGAVGSALATVGIKIFLLISIIIYIFNMKDHEKYGIKIKPKWNWNSWKFQRKLGYASAVGVGAEATAFATLSIFAGWIGIIPLGAYSIVFNLLALIFMIALGLGIASSVRVSYAHGTHDYKNMAFAGWTGLGVNSVMMLSCGVITFCFPEIIANAYANDSELISATIPLVVFASYFFVFDGGQGVMANILRGRGDAWIPAVIQAFAYFGVLIPLSYYLAILQNRGVMGLLEAILIASIFSVTTLSLRFHRLCVMDRK